MGLEWLKSGGSLIGVEQSPLLLADFKETALQHGVNSRLQLKQADFKNCVLGVQKKGAFCWSSSVQYGSLSDLEKQWKTFKKHLISGKHLALEVPLFQKSLTKPSFIEHYDWHIQTHWVHYVRHQCWVHESGQRFETRMRIWPYAQWRSWCARQGTPCIKQVITKGPMGLRQILVIQNG